MNGHLEPGCLTEIAQQALALMDSTRSDSGSSPLIKAEPDTDDTTMVDVPPVQDHRPVIEAGPDTDESFPHTMVGVSHDAIVQTEPDQEGFPHAMVGVSSVRDHGPIIKTEPEAEALALFPELNHESTHSLYGAREPVFRGSVYISFRPRAMQIAMAVQQDGSSQDHMVFWTGAAFPRRSQTAAYSVASQFNRGGWGASRFNRGGWGFKFHREQARHTLKYLNLKSIELALKEAVEHIRSTRHNARTIIFFNGDRTAVQAVKSLPRYTSREVFSEARRILDVLQSISELSRWLAECNTLLELLWMPRHDIRGGLLARTAASYASSRPNGLVGESWTFPQQAFVNNIVDEATFNPEMLDETMAEAEAEAEAKVKKEEDAEADAKVKKEEEAEMNTDMDMKDEHDDNDNKPNALVKVEADD
ncbi:hypothetical protein E4U42_003436 [Claviceps africana]|uniref:Uncharacterized protein n=1 Tax=Claviceps africana TaxID=83212 RepID=A0A8K0J7D9_9HYPO|nr:hypothetical protein E4U42_003436 [Claviceps africana]